MITHGGGRIKSRIACTKPLGGETLVAFVGFFFGVVAERLGGCDEGALPSGLDSDMLALSGYAWRVVGGVKREGRG